jgi:hypothetical protein
MTPETNRAAARKAVDSVLSGVAAAGTPAGSDGHRLSGAEISAAEIAAAHAKPSAWDDRASWGLDATTLAQNEAAAGAFGGPSPVTAGPPEAAPGA